MPRGCPPCCLFVLTFLTIKPQGQEKCLYPFIEAEGEIESEIKMDMTIIGLLYQPDGTITCIQVFINLF